jgi:predicted transcriptional regulator
MSIINSDKLTSHQYIILTMTFDGYTQGDIAKHIGITQSAVHKCLHGNLSYVKKTKGRRFGGIVLKLQRLCAKNERIQEILKEIQELKKNE